MARRLNVLYFMRYDVRPSEVTFAKFSVDVANGPSVALPKRPTASSFLMNDDARHQLWQLPHLQRRHSRQIKNDLLRHINGTFAVFVCFSSLYSSFLQLELVRYSTWRIYVLELALTIDLFKGNLGVENFDTKTISFLTKGVP